MTTWVVDVLTDIAEGRREIRAVRHPLGFICLPVDRAATDGVCVHVWHPELSPVGTAATVRTSQMHSHSWELDSYVLVGEVRNELVDVTDAADEPTFRVFEVCTSGDVDEVRATARKVRHSVRAVEVHRAGDAYGLAAGAFHATVVPPDLVTATVAVGRGRRGARDLALGPIDGSTHAMRRRHCDRAETARTARVVADHVAAAANGRGGPGRAGADQPGADPAPIGDRRTRCGG